MNNKAFFKSNKYKDHASWAVYGNTISDLSVFNDPNIKVKPKFVFAGLNASAKLDDFNNFHFESGMKGGRVAKDYRLRDLLVGTIFEGSYLTDLKYKNNDYESNSAKVTVTEEDIQLFLDEVHDVCGEDVVIIAMGGKVSDILRKHKIKHYKILHFSCYKKYENFISQARAQLNEIEKEIKQCK